MIEQERRRIGAHDPWGHNEFEKDVLILREFWNQLSDYTILNTKGKIINSQAPVNMVLSSAKEAVIYCSSASGVENKAFKTTELKIDGLLLKDGEYNLEFWYLVAPGNKSNQGSIKVSDGSTSLMLPEFTDDIVAYIYIKQ